MSSKRVLCVSLLITALAPAVHAGEIELHGFGAVRGIAVSGQPPWPVMACTASM